MVHSLDMQNFRHRSRGFLDVAYRRLLHRLVYRRLLPDNRHVRFKGIHQRLGEYGADQAQVLRDLIIDDFTPRHNIEVSLSLVQSGFVEAILAGWGGFSRRDSKGAPINLAVPGCCRI